MSDTSPTRSWPASRPPARPCRAPRLNEHLYARRPHLVSIVAEVGWAAEPRLLLVCTCRWRLHLGSTADYERVAHAVNHHITGVIRRRISGVHAPE